MTKLGIPQPILNVFNESFVSVTKNNNGNIYGDVICVLCYNISDTPEEVKSNSVFCRAKDKKKSWVISNFIKHIQSAHKDILNRPIIDKVLATECPISESMNQTKQEMSLENISCESISNDSVMTILNINEIGATEIEMFFNNQISKQAIKMWEAILINCEHTEPIKCVLKDNIVILADVVPMPKDGNCLFSSISHQLFKDVVNSVEHIESIKILRADVVNFIQENYKEFLYELRGHVYELKEINNGKQYGLDTIDDIDEACKYFLTNCLSLSGFWGGGECLKAVTHIHNVNILVFNENGQIYLVNNNQQLCDRTIAIAYRLSCHDDGKRNHYDSICNISAEDIYKTAKVLTLELMSPPLNADSIINLNVTS